MRAAIFAVFIVMAAINSSGEVTGNQVLDDCQKSIRIFDNNGGPIGEHFADGWCIGWISSVLAFTQIANEWSDFTKTKPALTQFCLPKDGIPVIQGVRIVLRYLNAHPEQLHENGMSLTLAGLINAFPCNR